MKTLSPHPWYIKKGNKKLNGRKWKFKRTININLKIINGKKDSGRTDLKLMEMENEEV